MQRTCSMWTDSALLLKNIIEQSLEISLKVISLPVSYMNAVFQDKLIHDYD